MMCACLYVFLSVCERISQTTSMILTKFFCACCLRPWLGPPRRRGGDEIPRRRGNFGVFFPTDNALYSIALGTHTKTAEPIKILFGLMTQVGPRYHVFD